MRVSFFTSTLLLIICSLPAFAQDKELFGNIYDEKKTEHEGFVIGINGSFDIPGADMAGRFGLSYRLGPSLLYKTKKNWLVGAKFDFILGNQMREDSLMINIAPYGSFIDNDGSRRTINIFERGYMVGIQAGKVIAISKDPQKAENGILVLTGVGFMEHKIRIRDKQNNIPQVSNKFIKGYDRLTNGLYVEQFVGYNHFGSEGFLNFYIGLNIAAGFTQGRRDYLYDVQRPDTGKRLDMLIGIKGGWYITLFKRKSDDYFYE